MIYCLQNGHLLLSSTLWVQVPLHTHLQFFTGSSQDSSAIFLVTLLAVGKQLKFCQTKPPPSFLSHPWLRMYSCPFLNTVAVSLLLPFSWLLSSCFLPPPFRQCSHDKHNFWPIVDSNAKALVETLFVQVRLQSFCEGYERNNVGDHEFGEGWMPMLNDKSSKRYNTYLYVQLWCNNRVIRYLEYTPSSLKLISIALDPF